MKTLVVNLFGAPGAGKSTGAAAIFSKLKMIGINAELIGEFAKDKVWEENSEFFKNQAYIFGKQFFRQSRCDGKVDVMITDSPLPLSILYNTDPYLTENFNLTVMDVFNSYNNLNFYINRVKKYNPKGRNQIEEESNSLVEPLKELLKERNILFEEVNGDKQGYDYIVKRILEKILYKIS